MEMLSTLLALNTVIHQSRVMQRISEYSSGLILGLRPANERRRYFVTTSHIDWAQT